MSAIHMMAIYKVKPDKLDDVRLAVTEFIGAVKENEPGALFYESYQGNDDVSFFHLMTFENNVAEELHRQTPHMAEFAKILHLSCEEEPGFVELELVGSNVR
jgi:quinol monooxygenase YgiN